MFQNEATNKKRGVRLKF